MLTNQKLKEINIRQNMLIRNLVGIKNKYSIMKPLLEALRIEEIPLIYFMHKLSFISQLMKNSLTSDVYIYLKEFYSSNKTPGMSFEKQVKSLERIVGM